MRNNLLKIQDIIKLNVATTDFRKNVILSDNQLRSIIECVSLLIKGKYKRKIFKISVVNYLNKSCFFDTEYKYNDTLEKLMNNLDLMLKEL